MPINSIFKKSIEMNLKIEKFLDTISNSLTLFERNIEYYLNDDMETFRDTMERICSLESEADSLELEIKVSLYKFMLIPDTRADVLSLVKSLDDIIDATEEITKDFFIQKPNFPEVFHKDLTSLTSNTVKSAESLLFAARAFFTELHMVSPHISKIKFYEHEADLLEDKISANIFSDGYVNTLAEKMQLTSFVSKISRISDEAEVIGGKLAIFTIKREI